MTRRYRPTHRNAPCYETGVAETPMEQAERLLINEANAAANQLCESARRIIGGRTRPESRPWFLDEPWEIETANASFVLVLRVRSNLALPETTYRYGNGALPFAAAQLLVDDINTCGGRSRWLREKISLLRELNNLF